MIMMHEQSNVRAACLRMSRKRTFRIAFYEGLNRSLADEKHRLLRPERIDPRRGPQSIRCLDRDRRDIWTRRAKLVILALGTIAIARLSSSAIEASILDSRTLSRNAFYLFFSKFTRKNKKTNSFSLKI